MVVVVLMSFIARAMTLIAARMNGVSAVIVMLEIVNMLAGPVLHAIQLAVLGAGNHAIVLGLVLIPFDSFLFPFQILPLAKCQFAADNALVNPSTLTFESSVESVFGKSCAGGYKHKNGRGNQYFHDMLFHCHTSLMSVSS